MVLSGEVKPLSFPQGRYDYRLSELIRQRAWVEIHQDALIHNVQEFCGILKPGTGLMAVVKADAYGHGAIRVAQLALEAGGQGLAIATLGEGIELREAGITAPILLLGASNTAEEVKAIAHWQLEPTICNVEQAQLFADTLKDINQTLTVHLKLDTGMSRLGTSWREALGFARLVQRLPYLRLGSVYSHLATADSPDPTIMRKQQQRFETAIAHLRQDGIHPPCLHLANSAATLNGQELHYDQVRVGLGLYGLYSAPHLQQSIDLQPVLRVRAKITQVKTIEAGAGVSYGHQFISDRPLQLSLIHI